MRHSWYKHLTLVESVGDSSSFDTWTYDGLPEGSTLLRTIVCVYVTATGVAPNALDVNNFPAPVAWALQEQNTEITPAFSLDNAYEWNDIHTIVDGLCVMAETGVVQRLATTGNVNKVSETEWTYTLSNVDDPWTLLRGNDRQDSHAQRYFDRGVPEFLLRYDAGPLAAYIGDPVYGLVATTKQLFSIPG